MHEILVDHVLPYTARVVHPSGMANSVRLKKNNKYKKDYPTGYIVDLLILPNRTEIADALL